MKRIVVLLTICSPFLLKAQGFQVSLQGQKQQAMGGTGTAMVQDAASLFYNPGATSFLDKNGVSVGVSPVISHVQFIDSYTSGTAETKSPVGFPFTAYAVFGKKDSKLKYGLAAYTPFGSTIDWQDGWSGRFITTHLQLSTIYIQPTMSYKLSDKLGIGAGFVYGTGKVGIERDMPVMDNDGNYGKAALSGSGHGFGFNAGIYYKPSDKISFGATYRSGVDMKMSKGKAAFTVPASLAASFPSGNFSSSLPLPKIISVGIAYQACKNLLVSFEGSMVGWKTYDTLSFDFEQNTDQLADIKSPRNYQNTFAYRAGIQYSINSKLDARAGLKYLVSPIRDGYVTPETPDATHLNYSAGLGYKLSSKLSMDMSFTYQPMKRTDTNLENQLSGTYKTYIFIPGISINYNF
jgi:long-chain fatty acid transport protein